MSKLTLTITRAGMERFTAAQLDDDLDLTIARVGLTDRPFLPAPTLEALPGEFRRIDTVSGEQVGDNIVHMTIRDEAAVGYTARGFGLFLADGTLFASYGQDDMLFEKSPRATFLAAIDIAFPTGDVRELIFGSTDFLNPPGTSARKGVVRFATPAEHAAGTSTETAVTPQGLRSALPIGTITLWFGATATVPAGWAICDGRTVVRSDGAGSIVTPDMRGRVAVGFTGGMAVGETFGERTRTVTTGAGGGHDHGFDWQGNTAEAPSGATLNVVMGNQTTGGGSGSNVDRVTINDPPHKHTVNVQGRTSIEAAHTHTATVDVAQPSLVLLYIMRV